MKITNPFLLKLNGFCVAWLTRLWMGTLDYKAMFFDPTFDSVHPDGRQPAIYLFWHENLLLPFYLRGRTDTVLLLSQHHDADWISAAARYLGFAIVRGSTTRGGAAALLKLMREHGSRHLAVTPDGPRGPRRELASGAVYLASRTGIPLIAVGIGFERPWRMRTWDRFAVPRLFSRARVIMSPPIYVPEAIGREEIELRRQSVERLLNRLTDDAEAWATTGRRGAVQQAVRREPAPLFRRRRGAN